MLASLVSLQQRNVKKCKKLMKTDNIEEKYSYLLNELRNSIEILSKHVAYDNVKSRKKMCFNLLLKNEC